jgi:cobalt-precorrin 5A hydrolase/precorrin-3B C17-methyltransferase
VIGLVAVTAAGRAAAAELAAAWPDARVYPGPAAAALPRAFAECDGVVAFLATGATVRLLAPLLGGKEVDPGVVCVDEARRHAVALVGGHAGGANRLAEGVAAALGCVPVVTTASDLAGVPALDELADLLGWRIEPGGDVSAVGAAVLSGERVTLVADRTWPLPALPPNVVPSVRGEPGTPAIVISDLADAAAPAAEGAGEAAGSGITGPLSGSAAVVVYRPRSLVVGVGASRGVSADEILELADAALADANLSPLSVDHLATAEVKADEDGLLTAAGRRGWPVRFYSAEALREIETPNPSAVVASEVGTPSVAEAAALIGDAGPYEEERGTAMTGAATGPGGARTTGPSGATGAAPADPAAIGGGRAPGAELVVQKRKSAMATVAVARHRPRGRLAIVGLGPGARDLLPPRAAAELRRCSVVVGLDQYVDSVRDLLRPGTRVLATGLGDEEARARSAVAEARQGHAVALVGSGDAGVYAMASPALEFAGTVPEVDVVGVPGVTAALAASNLLGAPLGHDHAYISLSDLHTPWEAIERRVRAAAEGDFVVCFYNPRSRARDWQLGKALATLAEHRPPDTPVGLVRNAARPGQRAELATVGDATGWLDSVDMYTVVIVGSSNTVVTGGRMVTPRGYRWAR